MNEKFCNTKLKIMKTKLSTVAGLATIVMAFVVLPQSSLAQSCSYTVENLMDCTVTFEITWHDGSCPNQCDQQQVAVNPGQKVTLTCSGTCGTLCDISAQVIAPFTSALVSILGNPTLSGAACCNCSNPGNTYNISCGGANAVIAR